MAAPPSSNTANVNEFVFMLTLLIACLALKLDFQVICGAVHPAAVARLL
jgi:hypothetical protein